MPEHLQIYGYEFWEDDRRNNVIYPSPHGEVITQPSEKGGGFQAGPYDFTENGYLTFTIGVQTVDRDNSLKDWSFVAWGESGDVYVYHTDGSKTDDWGKSKNMKKLGPKNKPEKWNAQGKTAMEKPNKAKVKFNDDEMPEMHDLFAPPIHREREVFLEWASKHTKPTKVENYAVGKKKIGHFRFENFSNKYTVEDNKLLDFTIGLPKEHWNAIGEN